jgi:lysozyme
MRKRAGVRRKSKKKTGFWSQTSAYFLALVFLILMIGLGYHYRDGLAYYFSFKTKKALQESKETKRISDIRNHQILTKNSDKVIGIDVSEYQGDIDWDKVSTIENEFPIEFVLMRATAGNDRADLQFKKNWKAVKKKKLIRGAYHYYRPNENSLAQAALFIKTVQLKKGDLPPVLDIEKLPKNQSIDSLKVGLRRWLIKVEAHYGVRPIIYSGEKYYTTFLKEEFGNYLFWIANYNVFVEELKPEWRFWQFTEKSNVSGITGNVDVNVYNGDATMLNYLTIGN